MHHLPPHSEPQRPGKLGQTTAHRDPFLGLRPSELASQIPRLSLDTLPLAPRQLWARGHPRGVGGSLSSSCSSLALTSLLWASAPPPCSQGPRDSTHFPSLSLSLSAPSVHFNLLLPPTPASTPSPSYFLAVTSQRRPDVRPQITSRDLGFRSEILYFCTMGWAPPFQGEEAVSLSSLHPQTPPLSAFAQVGSRNQAEPGVVQPSCFLWPVHLPPTAPAPVLTAWWTLPPSPALFSPSEPPTLYTRIDYSGLLSGCGKKQPSLLPTPRKKKVPGWDLKRWAPTLEGMSP